MVEQIKRCRYSFDEPVWSRISKEAKNFVASCLELDPSKRLTLKEATRHPWFSPKWRLSATPSVSIPNHEKNRVYDAMNEAAFKGRAINVSAKTIL
jgi:serine/threonine protein kinase